jgi:hypothetical protein
VLPGAEYLLRSAHPSQPLRALLARPAPLSAQQRGSETQQYWFDGLSDAFGNLNFTDMWRVAGSPSI